MFGDSDIDEGATLLQLCSDPPSLDVFTAEGSIDITTALVREREREQGWKRQVMRG